MVVDQPFWVFSQSQDWELAFFEGESPLLRDLGNDWGEAIRLNPKLELAYRLVVFTAIVALISGIAVFKQQ